MSNLKELIDRLYDEVTQQADLSATLDDAEETETLADIDAEQLRLTLVQMADVLQKEDLADLQEADPLSAAETAHYLKQWNGVCRSLEGLKRHTQELEADIERMQPWGDFDVVKLEKLQQHDCHVRFWTMPVATMATMVTEPWYTDHQTMVVSHDKANVYFITVTVGDEPLPMPEQARQVEICPCPVSTLIMLQTRDKDSIKRVQTLQGDFALAHYAELLATLRTALPEGTALPQKKHHAMSLRARMRKLFTNR